MKPFFNLLTFGLLFITLSNSVLAQEAENVEGSKTILWSKIEDGYQVEMIRENGHEYILKTPVEIVEKIKEKKEQNILFSSSEYPSQNVIPEIQTDELIRSRLFSLNAGMPMEYNPAIRKEIDRLLVSRKAIELALGRAQYFSPISDRAIATKPVPRVLKYLPLIESSFRPRGQSRVGARGVWQFMSSTARMYHLQVNRSVDQRLDPELSTNAALDYLVDLYLLLGDWNLALAGYNCGPGRVQRAIRMSGIENPTFWDIDHLLPRETRRYIPKFIAAVYVMEHSGQIGLLPNIDGYNEVKAEIDALKKSNFQTHQYANAAPSTSTIPTNSTVLTYQVKSGDNLGFIAQWYDVKASQLRGWNGISGNMIRAGQKLKIYVPENKAHIYSDINKLTFAQKQGDNNSQKNQQTKNSVAALTETNKNYIIYKIQNGDTLWDISKKNGISIEEIKQLNNISNTRNLKPGMVIKIREKS